VTGSRLFPIGAAAGLIGLVLVVLETTRTLTDNTLGTLGEVLLWVGVGLVFVGGLLLLTAIVRAPADHAPADHALGDHAPADRAGAP
jgi:protein-S-isoprenylcysteine O-methyltransferase Ste14